MHREGIPAAFVPSSSQNLASQLATPQNHPKTQVYEYVFVPEKGDKGEWVSWMSTTEKFAVDPKLQFNEVSFVFYRHMNKAMRTSKKVTNSLFLAAIIQLAPSPLTGSLHQPHRTI